MTINAASILAILNTIKSYLLMAFSFGVAVLAVGWNAPKFGITFLRLPSASPQELVYAAGMIWLMK
jgi:hypothetical protein